MADVDLHKPNYFNDLFEMGITPAQLVGALTPRIIEKLTKEIFTTYPKALFADFEFKVNTAISQELGEEEFTALVKEYTEKLWELIRIITRELKKNSDVSEKIAFNILAKRVSDLVQNSPIGPEQIGLDQVKEEVRKIYTEE